MVRMWAVLKCILLEKEIWQYNKCETKRNRSIFSRGKVSKSLVPVNHDRREICVFLFLSLRPLRSSNQNGFPCHGKIGELPLPFMTAGKGCIPVYDIAEFYKTFKCNYFHFRRTNSHPFTRIASFGQVWRVFSFTICVPLQSINLYLHFLTQLDGLVWHSQKS